MTKIDPFNIGVSAELYAASVLIDLGYDVLLPFDRRGKYDLAAISPDKKFYKFQVKRASWVKPSHTSSMYLRVQCASKGVYYTEQDIDFFLFVCPDRRVWMVPIRKLVGKQIITLDKRISKAGWSTLDRFPSEQYRIV